MDEIESSRQKIKKISDSLLENIRELNKLSAIVAGIPDEGISKKDANEIMPVLREFIDVVSVKNTWEKDEIITLLKEILVSNRSKRKNKHGE